MGTRSTTFVYDSNGKTPVVCMYRQFDGYVDGHGRELAKFLSGKKVVNGLRGDDKNVFNGPGCLAAFMVAFFKDEPGGIYLQSTDSEPEEYSYHIYCPIDGEDPMDSLKPTGKIEIKVYKHGRQIFKGSPEKLAKFEEYSEDDQ